MIEAILNPDLYHGENKKDNYFEGWYFKLVDKDNKNVFSFIPGIYKSKDNKAAHSFIQVLRGNDAKCEYIRYTAESFTYDKHSFNIAIGRSSFSINEMNLNIIDKNIQVSGRIKLLNSVKWPDSFVNPGSMGFYNYLCFMECYSQVCLVDGDTQGELNINGKRVDFNGGKVYIEKNWGKAFPKAWIWIQSNSFRTSRVSLSCSIGIVPFLHGSFNGFLAGFMLGDEFYEFTSINRSRMRIHRQKDDVNIKFYNKKYELNIRTESEEDKFILCMGPSPEGMVPIVRETLKGKVYVKLRNICENRMVFSDTGCCTGIEYGGEWKNF